MKKVFRVKIRFFDELFVNDRNVFLEAENRDTALLKIGQNLHDKRGLVVLYVEELQPIKDEEKKGDQENF